MRCLVTGAAGFIGSHLCERLLESNHDVVGLDALVPYYSPQIKQQNLSVALAHPKFQFHQVDLRTDPLDDLVRGIDWLFHLAAMPGLMRSWTDFDLYESCNVLATQRLLEAARKCDSRPKIIHASTSSVYGKNASGNESQPTIPISPYGITKLAAENLCRAYGDTFGVPVTVLRYFSVYGPRQRPDMGYHQFIHALLHDQTVVVTGTGEQVRGNTYVTDCVAATVAAVDAPPGETFNVGGGEAANVWDILKRLEAISGRSARVEMKPARPGDQQHTLADVSKLQQKLSWQPKTSLDEGLARQWEWQARRSQSITD